ncbi:hypothetical protein DEU56DRAFT_905694 [Suillus clintonianus]|uniref:uncharacterized protein n=1 Tax=Suillus clintonianus TaxID=1904413 RepID=UPI001B85BC11|nr:uncharacterized protein DEU56DRAFT_905694 [Suillus clintonianus]KAG2157017.1 hypothetical protein DEU56DRAFT_905694 [Suillus clintonianus]
MKSSAGNSSNILGARRALDFDQPDARAVMWMAMEPFEYPGIRDISETYTHGSYFNEAIPELVNNGHGNWMFSLNVPIPDEMVYPTFTSLEYTIKYGTVNGQATSMIQTSILLTKTSGSSSNAGPVLDGTTTDTPWIYIYRIGVGFPTQTIDSVTTMRLLSVQAQLLPHVRIIEDASHLYLYLHVAGCPSPLMQRPLIAEVSAAWVEYCLCKVLHDKIEAATVAERKRSEDERARLQAERKSAEGKLAKCKAEGEEKSAKKKSEDDQLVKETRRRSRQTRLRNNKQEPKLMGKSC